MAILEILQFPDARLREKSVPIAEGDVDAELRELVQNMADTMYAEPGVGLAAPQVGVHKRAIVVDTDWPDGERKLRVLLNPEIVEKEGEQLSKDEACLSVPDFKADVQRYERVVVQFRSLDWERLRFECNGLDSICFQHEIDHLDGVLYIDRISHLKRDLYVRRRKKVLRREQEEAGLPVTHRL